MSADQQTAEDSLLSRLRRKAALVINATKFTYHMESLKKKDGVTKSSATQFTKSQPLASSSPKMSSSPLIASNSPQQAASNTSYDSANLVIPKIQATSAEDSLSLLSSCEEEEEEEDKQITVQVTAHPKPVISSETGSYKSALRNAVSTGSLAKKKVLFVDEAIREEKKNIDEGGSGEVHTLNKKKLPRQKRVTNLDNFQKDAIRHVYAYYRRKQYPILKKLIQSLKDADLFNGCKSSLSLVLKQLGFKYKSVGKRKVLFERPDVVAWRCRFLRQMKNLNLDEVVWIDKDMG
ncbi:hypothetical protein J6590_056475 [Homalodisca vitripennis]|nr:hypothetical protein J6590_056475 [Homalodisca vitripennis]